MHFQKGDFLGTDAEVDGKRVRGNGHGGKVCMSMHCNRSPVKPTCVREVLYCLGRTIHGSPPGMPRIVSRIMDTFCETTQKIRTMNVTERRRTAYHIHTPSNFAHQALQLLLIATRILSSVRHMLEEHCLVTRLTAQRPATASYWASASMPSDVGYVVQI